MVRIAVDGMGGDFAPQAIVKGAEQAFNEKIADVVLVGVFRKSWRDGNCPYR
jgi:glycerol-3-phosphate acyltransferase PlsX